MVCILLKTKKFEAVDIFLLLGAKCNEAFYIFEVYILKYSRFRNILKYRVFVKLLSDKSEIKIQIQI